MWKFEIYQDSAWEYRFRLKASNGMVIFNSEGYSSIDGCENWISSVKKNSQNIERHTPLRYSWGRFGFQLTAVNWQSIWRSEIYQSLEWLQRGVDSIMKNAITEDILIL